MMPVLQRTVRYRAVHHKTVDCESILSGLVIFDVVPVISLVSEIVREKISDE